MAAPRCGPIDDTQRLSGCAIERAYVEKEFPGHDM
jgi:hypothetical protein